MSAEDNTAEFALQRAHVSFLRHLEQVKWGSPLRAPLGHQAQQVTFFLNTKEQYNTTRTNHALSIVKGPGYIMVIRCHVHLET